MKPPFRTFSSLIVGAPSLIVWVVLAIIDARAALQGWTIGFVFVASLCMGSLAIVLMRRLVGGGWGEALAPVLSRAAGATPILLLLVLPVLAGLRWIYPWAAAPDALDLEVHRFFLNVPLFVGRSALCLIGCSAISLTLSRIEGPSGRLYAALGLAFYGLVVTILAIDLLITVEPSWTSSNIGMDYAVQQLACGFAVAAIQARHVETKAAGDLAGLMFATVIGLIYLAFVDYLVVWYGDRPSLDRWYVSRASGPWQVLPWASLLCSALAIGLLTVRRAVGTRRAIALAGGCVLAGVLSYQAWLLAPDFGGACLVPAAFAVLGQGGLWFWITTGLPRPLRHTRGVAHAA